jgi:hypothetical protein
LSIRRARTAKLDHPHIYSLWVKKSHIYQQCFHRGSIGAQFDGSLAFVGKSVQSHSGVKQGLGALNVISICAEMESSATVQDFVDDGVHRHIRHKVANIGVNTNFEQ